MFLEPEPSDAHGERKGLLGGSGDLVTGYFRDLSVP